MFGRWFELYYEDKRSLLATMYRNMAADIEAGYNPMGENIRRQKAEIDRYQAEFDDELEKIANMDENKVERWCYLNLLKRGAISR